ncbi:hypothetical protein OIU78_004038 [Salix suchowensis]|nr:hypothetical protein OIU78_004038 [Salix suchowensis]
MSDPNFSFLINYSWPQKTSSPKNSHSFPCFLSSASLPSSLLSLSPKEPQSLNKPSISDPPQQYSPLPAITLMVPGSTTQIGYPTTMTVHVKKYSKVGIASLEINQMLKTLSSGDGSLMGVISLLGTPSIGICLSLSFAL